MWPALRFSWQLPLVGNAVLPNDALRRWEKKNKKTFSSSSDAQINLAPPRLQQKYYSNKTFLQLLIKYNTAKFHLQHIILIMGMEIIHSIAIQK